MSARPTRPHGFTLLEVAIASVIGAMVIGSFIVVDGEVRRSYATIRRELILESIYRDLASDQEATVFPALCRAAQRRAWAGAPIQPAAGQIIFQGDPTPTADTVVRFLAPPDGARLDASHDGGSTWRRWIAIGDRTLLRDSRFHYAGWVDAADVPPPNSRPYALDERVRYDLVRIHHHLGGPEGIPFYAQAAWAPRATDWRWAAASRAGIPIPPPTTGIFAPIAVWRGTLPGAAGTPFDLFDRGQGSGGIGWLSWNGAPDTDTLAQNLAEPRSNAYTNPDDASGTDHLVTQGSWIPATPGHHTGVQPTFDGLLGREIRVVVWERSRGRGANTDIQAVGFVRLRVDTTAIPDARATFLSWTDDQGRDLPEPEWPAGPAPTAAPSAPVATPTATATPAPSPSPGLPLMPIALNLPAGTPPGTSLGWCREHVDFAWLSWSGATGAGVLATSLTWPGDVATYVAPGNAADRVLDVGDEIAGAAATVDASVSDRVEALEGATFVVPVYDQVTDQRYRTSGFARVTLEREEVTGGRMRLTFLGSCTADGTPR